MDKNTEYKLWLVCLKSHSKFDGAITCRNYLHIDPDDLAAYYMWDGIT